MLCMFVSVYVVCGVRKLVREVGDLWYSKALCVEGGVRKLVISKLVTRRAMLLFLDNCTAFPSLGGVVIPSSCVGGVVVLVTNNGVGNLTDAYFASKL